MRYTVQNAPFPIKQLNALYGSVVGGTLYLILRLIHATVRVEHVGREHLLSGPDHILAFWHENLPIFFVVNIKLREPHIWLQHPMLFMKPVHVLAKLLGVRELAYGSSGNKGKLAMQRVTQRLREGYSTMINPDGPAGPVKKLKPGVLIMAERTGVPIVPVTMDASPKWVMNTWDRKKMPLPFSKIVVQYHPPLWVSGDIDQAMIDQLEATLSRPVPVRG